jgi:hypothetical protein
VRNDVLNASIDFPSVNAQMDGRFSPVDWHFLCRIAGKSGGMLQAHSSVKAYVVTFRLAPT